MSPRRILNGWHLAPGRAVPHFYRDGVSICTLRLRDSRCLRACCPDQDVDLVLCAACDRQVDRIAAEWT